MLADTAHLVVSLLMAGVGMIFLWNDRANAVSRVLAYCLLTAAMANLLDSPQSLSGLAIWLTGIAQLSETAAMLFGVEWAYRLSQTAEQTDLKVRAARALLRSSQIVLLVYGLLSLGYIIIFPEYAVIDANGPVKVRPVEFAVFAPLLGTTMLLAGLAIVLLLVAPLDPVERIRFRSLLLAGPLFLLTLLFNNQLETLLMALGLLIFLSASVRYLLIQTERGAAMRQFVSPELARIVSLQGTDSAMRRERREISVVACDLRGFTAYAASTDSHTVVELLERYYAEVGRLATEYGGTVKDHAGDGILILVGAPREQTSYARSAVNLAQAIVARMAPLLAQDTGALGLGIGVATGEATIGAIQGAGRLEYVAVGSVVNLAARLCDMAADGEVLIDATSREQAELMRSTCSRGNIAMKGFAQALPVYALSDLRVSA